jgi:multiple sugar transport system permease protein
MLFWVISSHVSSGPRRRASSATRGYRSKKHDPHLDLALGSWRADERAIVLHRLYAGLETVSADTLESSTIYGARRRERIRLVVIPHLITLGTFAALVELKDNLRVIKPMVAFDAEANVTSLFWSVFNDLRGQVDPLLGSAVATSLS